MFPGQPDLTSPPTPTELSPHEQGPAYVREMAAKVDAYMQRLELLHRAFVQRRTVLPLRERIGGQTDANGNADFLLYDVPAGMIVEVHRVVVEAQGFTPATAAIANGWLALYLGGGATLGQAVPVGSMIDFAPPNAGNAGLVFPALSTDAANEGTMLRSGERLFLHVVGTATLASKQLSVLLQGLVSQQGGAHVEVA